MRSALVDAPAYTRARFDAGGGGEGNAHVKREHDEGSFGSDTDGATNGTTCLK